MAGDNAHMSCRDAERALARHAEADSASAVDPRLADHLQQCGRCRSALEDQRMVAALLRSRPVDGLSAQFDSRLSARLDDVSGWFGLADWRAWTFRLAPVAGGLALAALVTSMPATTTTAVDPVTLDEWTIAAVGSSSTASILRGSEVTTDAVLESMLTGDGQGSGGSDAR